MLVRVGLRIFVFFAFDFAFQSPAPFTVAQNVTSAAFNEPFAEPRGAMRVQFIPRLDEELSVLGHCWQGRHFPPEAVRGAGYLVCQVPCMQDAWLKSAGRA